MPRRKIIFISAAATFFVLLALLAGYFLYFGLGQRALPGTKIGNVDVTGKTAEQIKTDLQKTIDSKQINFKGSDLDGKSAKLNELGISISVDQLATEALAPNNSFTSYFTLPFTGHKIDPVLDIDETALNAYSLTLAGQIPNAKTVVEPKIVAENENFTILPGEPGTGIDPKVFSDAAQKLVTEQNSVSAQIILTDITPKTNVADLEATKTEAEKMLATQVNITAGEKSFIADTKTKISWIGFDANKITVNEEAIKNWLLELSKPLEQLAAPGIRNVDSSGKVYEIVKTALPEKKITNFDQVLASVKDSFAKTQAVTATLTLETGTETWNDRLIAKGAENLPYKAAEGQKWIDVNLSTFTMRAYEGASPVRGPITVTIGEPNSPTVQGKFKIWHKTAAQDMRGTHSDGSEYHIKNVPWNMFFSGDYAIHGAPWWGPNEWGMRASNGCVNTPVPEAKWIFQWAPVGTVVYTHY